MGELPKSQPPESDSPETEVFEAHATERHRAGLPVAFVSGVWLTGPDLVAKAMLAA